MVGNVYFTCNCVTWEKKIIIRPKGEQLLPCVIKTFIWGEGNLIAIGVSFFHPVNILQFHTFIGNGLGETSPLARAVPCQTEVWLWASILAWREHTTQHFLRGCFTDALELLNGARGCALVFSSRTSKLCDSFPHLFVKGISLYFAPGEAWRF